VGDDLPQERRFWTTDSARAVAILLIERIAAFVQGINLLDVNILPALLSTDSSNLLLTPFFLVARLLEAVWSGLAMQCHHACPSAYPV
jgi:hypothetical protein